MELKNMALKENLRVMINFCKKLCLPVITWNKKHLSKEIVPITNTLDKTFFIVATFEDF